jgi:hypothetical protein
MDGRGYELEASPYILQLYSPPASLDYVKRPETLVANEGYHSQHSCEQDGWITGGGTVTAAGGRADVDHWAIFPWIKYSCCKPYLVVRFVDQ